ncbi:MAG TPA: PsbP-related protein [Candidatus Saccharimonadales bacterium]|nr:PsbP-related protein [Candidatus Saccharimonadales bacterium]
MDPVINSETPEKSPPNKKIVIGAAIFIAVVVVFVLITIISESMTTKNSVSQDLSKQPPKNPQQVIVGSPNQNSSPSNTPQTEKWTTYKNSQFSIDYPADWHTQELIFPNGDIGTTFQPSAQSDATPSFDIIRSKTSSQSAISQKQQGYINLGFDKSYISIDNLQATKLTGPIPSRSKTNSTPVKAIQVNHIYFSRGDDYLLKYAYSNVGIDQSLEATFTQMISSFKFIQ